VLRNPFLNILFALTEACGLAERIVTRYGQEVPGADPIGSEIYPKHPDRPWCPPSLL